MSKKLISIENWHEYATNPQAYLYEPVKGIYEKYHAKLADLKPNTYEGYEEFICIVLLNGADAPPQLTQAAIDALKEPPIRMATFAELEAMNVGLQQTVQANKKVIAQMTTYIIFSFVCIAITVGYSGYQHVQLQQIGSKMADNTTITKIKAELKTVHDQLDLLQTEWDKQKVTFVKSIDLENRFKNVDEQLGTFPTTFVKLSDFNVLKQQVNQFQTPVNNINDFLTNVQPNVVTRSMLDQRDKPFRDRLQAAETAIAKINALFKKK